MPIERRFQVFVSSTYEDLLDERREVMQALLELDCIPAGMELFPAADDDQWTLIRQVINDCDYYILIVGGRYGSIGPTGKSYTEMEYEHAVASQKPVIAFLHKDPFSLPAKRNEKTEDGRARLVAFRAILEKRMCRYWTNSAELGSLVSRSLVKLVKSHPAVGWARGDQVADVSAAEEILRLKKQVEELQGELAQVASSAPKGTEHLSQGDDRVPIRFDFKYNSPGSAELGSANWQVSLTWNEIFARIGPLMIDEAPDRDLLSRINDLIKERAQEQIKMADDPWKDKTIVSVATRDDAFRELIIQYRALNLIVEMARPQRAASDTATYFHLTPYGDRLMTSLRAVTRKQVGAIAVGGVPQAGKGKRKAVRSK